MFKTFKHILLKLSPDPEFPFVSEQVQRGNNIGEIWDKFPVKICESSE